MRRFLRLLRPSLVVLIATVAAAMAVRLAAPVATARGPGFEDLLVSGCAFAVAACAVWGWLGVVVVAVDAVRGGGPGDVAARATPGVPAGLRRAVLAACGVALSAQAVPALATPGSDPAPPLPSVVAGLPFPSRAVDLPAERAPTVVVRPGDSLWAIAQRHLPPDADDAAVTSGWHQVYLRNRAVVGDDPSLIHPGQRLALPVDLEESP